VPTKNSSLLYVLFLVDPIIFTPKLDTEFAWKLVVLTVGFIEGFGI